MTTPAPRAASAEAHLEQVEAAIAETVASAGPDLTARRDLARKLAALFDKARDDLVRGGRPWTAEDIERLTALWPDNTTKDVAAALTRSPCGVQRKAEALGLRRSREHVSKVRREARLGRRRSRPAP